MIRPRKTKASGRICRNRFFAFVVLSLVSTHSALAFSGAAVPWTTYEVENMTISGGTILTSYTYNNVASESSGRKCVQLNGTGQYVQFTNQSAANAMVVRYSVPDTANGTGTNYTISLYTNGVFCGKLPITSMYSWRYGNYPFTNNPSVGSPRNFYDEVRTNGLNLNPGDVVRLQVDGTDTATNYVIDLVDLENVAAPISAPANSLSIVSYGGDTNGVNDSTVALQNCISAAQSQGKTVWLPVGTYVITNNIGLPPNATVQGAGMWYSKLVGNPVLYTNAARRVALYGYGSNIHLADFAIIGKLNYRNDPEANDGLGGSYGTGSTIARVWVEHTKTGAWLINSSGLVVSDCRFRDTIADGINLCVGMRGTTVTNCTARGTGDDCFAIWPTTYTSQTYTPGLNVITHCTAQSPCQANAGAIYGGVSNRIEDCLFKDTIYGCGILISTTFSVANNVVTNSFSGTTVVQRCDLVRCGGYNPGYLQWRAALQLCLDTYSGGISGVGLNNLNITDSISDGMSIIGGTGILTNAVVANVSIPNYGIGVSGRHALWARNDVVGSMIVSNSAIPEYRNDSSKFFFTFVTNNGMSVTVQANPSGLSFTVDGTNYTSAQTFNWTPGANHTIAIPPTQNGSAGVQYAWNSWSDAGAISHIVSPTVSTNYTANFTTQYYLTLNAGAGGTVSPGSLWTNSGAVVNINAAASNNYVFFNWTGSGSGAYSGNNNAASVTMNGPIAQTASFTTQAQRMTFVQAPGTVLQGATIAPEVQVQAFDTNSQPLANAMISLSLGSGTGTLAGTLTRSTDNGGIAHFNDLIVNQAGPKILTATAASGNAPPTNSSSFMVISSVAARWSFDTGTVADLISDTGAYTFAVAGAGTPTYHAGSVSLPSNAELVATGINSTNLPNLTNTATVWARMKFDAVPNPALITMFFLGLMNATAPADYAQAALVAQYKTNSVLNGGTGGTPITLRGRVITNGVTIPYEQNFAAFPGTNVYFTVAVTLTAGQDANGNPNPGKTRFQLFINGSLVGSGSQDGPNVIPILALCLGELKASGGVAVTFDEVQVWDQTLMSNQIAQIEWPTASPDVVTTPWNVPVTVSPLANDVDLNSYPLTVVSVSPANATASIIGGTNVLITPTLGAAGMAYVAYAITNGNGGSDSSLITVTVTTPPRPVITLAVNSGSAIVLSGSNGSAKGIYQVLSSTNLALPVANWTPILTNTFDAGGGFNVTNTIDPASPAQFLLFKQ